MTEGAETGAPPATYLLPEDRPGASMEPGAGPGVASARSDADSDRARQGRASASPTARLEAPARVGRRSKVQQVFVVTMARSGSTLLRYLLDSHPEVTSPPELNLSALLSHAAGAWQRAEEALRTGEPSAPGAGPSPEACRQARKVVDAIMLKCANAAGASLFCDKSLTTVDHLDTVSRCYPKASYVFLYRYPLDLIASGIEASRWGFSAFGFAPYLGSAPGNFVAGLANYWIDRASKMLAFERSCSVAHARVYYELLCDDPTQTLSDLVGFLGLTEEDAMFERAFAGDHGRGPGDYKIDFTREVSGASIGRGSTLPHMLAPQQIEQMDELLAELDYPSLDSAWRGDLRALLGLKTSPAVGRGPGTDTDELMAVLRRGFDAARVLGHPPSLELVIVGGDSGTIGIAIDPEQGVTMHREVPPPAEGRPRVRCTGDVLLRVAAGDVNLAQAGQDGLVRVETDGPVGERWRAHQTLLVLAGLLGRRGEAA